MDTQDQRRARITADVEAYFSELTKPQPFVPGKSKIWIGGPAFDGAEVNAVLAALMEQRLSQGPFVERFEREYAQYIGAEHAVAFNSGSSANLVALNTLLELGKLKRGDEVIIPSATFATVASPILQLGLTPVYVDIERDTYNIDPAEIEKAIGPKTKVLMPVHSMGNATDMKRIMEIAQRHELQVIEDCCEAHGSAINSRKVGSWGDLCTYSFFVAHNMTTGEGGMILTNDQECAEMARSLREFGRIDQRTERFGYSDGNLQHYDKRYVFMRLGFNVRMTDMAAAFGSVQLRKLDAFNAHRAEVAAYYSEQLADLDHVLKIPQVKSGVFHSWYGYTLVVQPNAPFTRQQIVTHLEAAGIETRPFMGGSLAHQPGFRNQPKRVVGELPVTQWIRDNAFFVATHPGIGHAQRTYVAAKIREGVARYR